MATVSEAVSGSKPPLGAALAEGVKTLSADQHIDFVLYREYIFPLDGMRYWLRVPSSSTPVTGPGVQPSPGLASATVAPGEAIQVVAGGLGAMDIVGGVIINPPDATEPLFVDPTGPAYSYVNETTQALAPGASFKIPANPTDGVWVNAATAGHAFTVVVQNSIPVVSYPTDVSVAGSLHYDSTTEQREDAVVDSNSVIFTSLAEIQPFNVIGPNYRYIATYKNIRFAFSSRGRLYEQADLYHYLGKALYSVNATQIIDDPSKFNPTLVVSNSLPIWLNMNNYVPPYPGFRCPFPLYPSYLVTDNLPPPFGSVHIDRTMALQICPATGPRWQADQLCRDHVIIHTYGADNQKASDLRDFVEQYSVDWNLIGIATSSAILDHKHQQSEFEILAQRKSIVFDVNYLQSASRDIARQYIEHAKVQFYPIMEPPQ